MPMNYSVRFDPKFGYYRARFWERGITDTYAKVPAKFWRELGIEPPTEKNDKHEKLALKWAAAEVGRRETALVNGHNQRAHKMNLREAFEFYCERRAKKVAGETVLRDRVSFAAIARHVDVDAIIPEQVDEPMIERYKEERAEDVVTVRSGKSGATRKEIGRTVRNRTINNEVDLAQRLVKFSWKWRNDLVSPTNMERMQLDEIERLPEQDSQQVALTEGAVGEMLAGVDGYKRQMIIFGICSRLRDSNLLPLRGEWVSWPESWIRIPAEHMKGGNRALSIPLPAIAMEQLGDPRLKGYIWANPETGLPYTKITGIERFGISLHDLRTTGNTWLYNHGVDHLTRKALMGHSLNTGDVTDLYTKVMDEKMIAAVSVLDDIFKRLLRPSVKVVAWEKRGN